MAINWRAAMSLLFSIFLMPLSSILVKYNRMSSVPGQSFFPFAATALTEALKGVMCLSIYFFTRNMNSAPASDAPKATELETDAAVAEPKSAYEHFQDSLYYALPSFLYMVDNNLMFVVLRYISPATLHLFSNMKIIFVAVLFRFALNRAINRIQWLILFCLVGGLIIAQSDQGVSASASRIVTTNATAVEQIAPSAATVGSITQSLAASHQWRAFALVCLMCLCSAVASILLEYAYKTRKQEMLLQQFQLYVYGVIMNLVSLFIHNAVDISKDGVFRGFNPLVWAIICASACTGIAVSYVLKYSDNIGNIFAHAAALIVTALVSSVLFDFKITLSFMIGVLIVKASCLFYHLARDPDEEPAKSATYAYESIQLDDGLILNTDEKSKDSNDDTEKALPASPENDSAIHAELAALPQFEKLKVKASEIELP